MAVPPTERMAMAAAGGAEPPPATPVLGPDQMADTPSMRQYLAARAAAEEARAQARLHAEGSCIPYPAGCGL